MFTSSNLSLQLPREAPFLISIYRGIIYSGIPFLCGFFLLINFRLGIAIYGFIIVFIGGLLHIPYTSNEMRTNPISQSRKFVTTMIVFVCMVIAASKSIIELFL